ncbi:hypothetical protein BKA56DRAFT_647518 [Ilyonectria sp. MPI-CAGE-AT-0026]|nr:hypothetical protein BKA56DRAFT_647518 [Ilyonectria sp. MPI-CAGE-AT-0026]
MSVPATQRSSLDDYASGVPYSKSTELFDNSGDTIPGQPLVKQSNRDQVLTFLKDELSTLRLEAMSWAFFLISKRRNISPLHHQIIKGRRIIITERPDLHLIWHYDRIFIKPIPICLFSYDFYQSFLGSGQDQSLRRDADGLLRTYSNLIIHESDFNMARDNGLVPSSIDWTKWCHYIDNIRHLSDSAVSHRYQYGEIRLTRLNFCTRLVSFGSSYLEIHHQYLTFFASFLGPYVFIFSAAAVILTAMQTAVTADPESTLKGAISSFCMFSVVLTILGLVFFPALYLFFQLRELLLFFIYHQKKM